MNDDYVLTEEQSRLLMTTIQTLEFTGPQLTIIANALAFNLVHNDCLMKRNPYSAVYYEELDKLHQYVAIKVAEVIGDNHDKKIKIHPTK